jgi:hypothetical protein
MSTTEPFWRRSPPPRDYDIALLRQPSLEKGQRFETMADVGAECLRSERLLRSSGYASLPQQYLSECRAGYYHCERTYCALCARSFRRWFVGQTLGIVDQCLGPNQVTTILLAKSKDINDLDPGNFRASARRRLHQAGLKGGPVIGGFEMVYRAHDKCWILHMNLLTLGSTKLALNKFEESFESAEFVRPTQTVPLVDLPEQLSYLLKFTTYHRPLHQKGPKRSPAKPLNTREHVTLIKWMSRYEFSDMMFLYGIRREGDRLRAMIK